MDPARRGNPRLVGTIGCRGRKDVDAAGAQMAYVSRCLLLRPEALRPLAGELGHAPAARRHASGRDRGHRVPSRRPPRRGRPTSPGRSGSGQPTADPSDPFGSSTARESSTSPTVREGDGWPPAAPLTPRSRSSGTSRRRPATEPLRFPIGPLLRQLGLRPIRTLARRGGPRIACGPSESPIPAPWGGTTGSWTTWPSRPTGRPSCPLQESRRRGPRAVPVARRPGDGRILLRAPLNRPRLAVDPKGDAGRRLRGGQRGVFVVPLSGGPARRLEGFSAGVGCSAVAFSPDGRRLAAAGHGPGGREGHPDLGPRERRGARPGAPSRRRGGLRGRGEPRVPGRRPHRGEQPPSGVLLFDLRGVGTRCCPPVRARVAVGSASTHRLCRHQGARRARPDQPRRSRAHDGVLLSRLRPVALDPAATIVAAGAEEGIVRVGPASGGEPHLFFSRSAAAQGRLLARRPLGGVERRAPQRPPLAGARRHADAPPQAQPRRGPGHAPLLDEPARGQGPAVADRLEGRAGPFPRLGEAAGAVSREPSDPCVAPGHRAR